MVLGALAFGTGIASSIMGSRAKKKAAAAAAAEAKRIREWYEQKARDTKQTLGREIETMRTLRDLDLPAHQQAAKIAYIQRQKGSERQARVRALGRMSREVRDATFGGQLTQYLGREGQKIDRYAKMSQNIYGMASGMQQQVNQLLQAGGSEYGSMMKSAQMMEYEAGDPLGQALGAAAQGFSLAAKQQSQEAALKKSMESQFKRDFFSSAVFGDQKIGTAMDKARSIGDMMDDPDFMNLFKGMFNQ